MGSRPYRAQIVKPIYFISKYTYVFEFKFMVFVGGAGDNCDPVYIHKRRSPFV